MLVLAQPKFRGVNGTAPSGLAGDSLVLPFPEAVFAGVTVSFGLRNVDGLERALGEMLRVVEVGGRASILEFALPRNRAIKGLYLFYFRRLLPRLGALLSPRGTAYQYLPDSVGEFPQRDDFIAHMAAAGWREARWKELSGGTVCLYTARRTA
jgi:demethylmenaquinone methyltransferase/2-methoxy-6-polyprenyl-1,4-benzoquinol methylase